jgi:hypothetical protein
VSSFNPDITRSRAIGSRLSAPPIPQYSLLQIVLIWSAAAIPMGLLGWFVAPALSLRSGEPLIARLGVLTVGLAWQFVLVAWLVHRETGTFRWSSDSRRLWLEAPRDPGTGQTRRSLWYWVIPFVLLTAIYDLLLRGPIDRAWVSVFPLLAEPRHWRPALFLSERAFSGASGSACSHTPARASSSLP